MHIGTIAIVLPEKQNGKIGPAAALYSREISMARIHIERRMQVIKRSKILKRNLNQADIRRLDSYVSTAVFIARYQEPLPSGSFTEKVKK